MSAGTNTSVPGLLFAQLAGANSPIRALIVSCPAPLSMTSDPRFIAVEPVIDMEPLVPRISTPLIDEPAWNVARLIAPVALKTALFRVVGAAWAPDPSA